MSTKIYNGYKIQAQSLDEVISVLYSLKPEAVTQAQKDLLKTELNIAIDIYDETIINNTFNKKEEKEESSQQENSEKEKKKFKPNMERSAIINGHSKVVNHVIDRENRYNDDESYINLNITVFPESVMIKKQKYYLFCMYGDQSLEKWMDTKLAQCKMSEYGYWDNTDPMEDVTDAQWRLREKHWNKVLVGNDKTGIPAIEGIGIVLAKENKLYLRLSEEKEQQYMQEILDSNPNMLSVESRMREHWDMYMLSTIMDRLIKNQPTPKKDDLMQNALDNYHEARKIIRENKFTQEDSDFFEKVKDNFSKSLKPDLTLNDLNIPLKDVVDNAIEQFSAKKINKIKQ